METLPTFESFGSRLRWWREKRGFGRGKQGKFAAALGIGQGSLSELETQIGRLPSAEVLLRASAVLGLRPQYLLTGEGTAEVLNFSEISGEEAQLVMIYRSLPAGMKQAMLIDAMQMAESAKNEPAPSVKPKKRELV